MSGCHKKDRTENEHGHESDQHPPQATVAGTDVRIRAGGCA
ncbi:MAG: hypothetical protein O7F16_03925 [Acidobacteria bacterium]|nr:hypothetical protein [Acidobacteriota bacterium]